MSILFNPGDPGQSWSQWFEIGNFSSPEGQEKNSWDMDRELSKTKTEFRRLCLFFLKKHWSNLHSLACLQKKTESVKTAELFPAQHSLPILNQIVYTLSLLSVLSSHSPTHMHKLSRQPSMHSLSQINYMYFKIHILLSGC